MSIGSVRGVRFRFLCLSGSVRSHVLQSLASVGSSSGSRILLCVRPSDPDRQWARVGRFRSLLGAARALRDCSSDAYLVLGGVTIARNFSVSAGVRGGRRVVARPVARVENVPTLSIHSIRWGAAVALRQLVIDGGFSLSTLNLGAPSSGFIVSRAGSELVLDSCDENDIAEHWANHSVRSSDYYGGWRHDGKVFLDVSKRFDSLLQALSFAVENRQLAIWDCAGNRSIYVDDALPLSSVSGGGLQNWSVGSDYPLSVSFRGDRPYVWNLLTGAVICEFRAGESFEAHQLLADLCLLRGWRAFSVACDDRSADRSKAAGASLQTV